MKGFTVRTLLAYVNDRATACDDIVKLLMGYLWQLRKHDHPRRGDWLCRSHAEN